MPHLSKSNAPLAAWELLAAAVLVESRQFPAKKTVVRKVPLQRQQEFASARHVFLADVGDGQQDPREWGEQMAFRCSLLEFGNAASLIPRNAPQAQEPAHRTAHRSPYSTPDPPAHSTAS